MSKNLHNVVGQSIMEFTTVLTLVIIVLFTMTPMVKRSIQAMTKVAADQIGSQENAEQAVYSDPDSGYMQESISETDIRTNKRTRDVLGEVTYTYDDTVTSNTETRTYLGVSEY